MKQVINFSHSKVPIIFNHSYLLSTQTLEKTCYNFMFQDFGLSVK